MTNPWTSSASELFLEYLLFKTVIIPIRLHKDLYLHLRTSHELDQTNSQLQVRNVGLSRTISSKVFVLNLMSRILLLIKEVLMQFLKFKT